MRFADWLFVMHRRRIGVYRRGYPFHVQDTAIPLCFSGHFSKKSRGSLLVLRFTIVRLL